MDVYKEMYVLMFRGVEYAARLIEQGDAQNALLALRVAQWKAEELLLQSEEKNL